MRYAESFRSAASSLRANSLRSILTTLGIIIGVASVIVMVAVGEGARMDLEKRISRLGTNILQLRPGTKRIKGRSVGADKRLPFSERDIAAIKQKVPAIVAISGHFRRGATVVYGSANWLTYVDGVHPDYEIVHDWNLEIGRFLSQSDYERAATVVVLGATTSKELFGEGNPVGSTVRIHDALYDVIGLLEQKGASPSGKDLDDVVLIPLSTTRKRLVKRHKLVPDQVGYIKAKVEENGDMEAAAADVKYVLGGLRRTSPTGNPSFRIRDVTAYKRAKRKTQNTLGMLLATTAAISLIVGGIGIMNIMLVSVSERTREIGLRMALGARRFDIRAQFLIEAVILCLLGGFIGATAGVAGAVAIAMRADWPILVSPGVVALALCAAAFVGILFGIVPAQRAANLNPIDALRSE